MSELKRNEKRYIIWIVVLYGIYDFSILLSKLLGTKAQIIIGIICFCLLYILVIKCLKMKIINVFMFLLVTSINSSYSSILGVPYARLPLTWFLIASVVIIFFSYKKIRKNSSLFASIIFVFFFLISIMLAKKYNIVNAINQFINIILFLLMLSSLDKLKDISSTKVNSCMKIIYFGSVFVFSLMIIIQKHLYESGNIDVGYIGKFARRISYAATFNDFSFATLYIASGFCLLFAQICYKKKIFTIITSMVFMSVYMYAILIVNARTGLVALIIALLLMFNSLVVRQKRLKILLIEICAIPIVFALLWIMSSKRAGMLNGSGRIEGYIIGLKCFFEYFWIGCGFGIQNYASLTGETIPHNFIVQYLAQFGIIGFSIMFYGAFPMIKKILFEKENIARWAVLTVIIGAMFIPDIISSHYCTVIILVAACEVYDNKKMASHFLVKND